MALPIKHTMHAWSATIGIWQNVSGAACLIYNVFEYLLYCNYKRRKKKEMQGKRKSIEWKAQRANKRNEHENLAQNHECSRGPNAHVIVRQYIGRTLRPRLYLGFYRAERTRETARGRGWRLDCELYVQSVYVCRSARDRERNGNR